RDLGERDVDAPEPHAVVRGEDDAHVDRRPVAPGHLCGLVADQGPEPSDEDRAHDAAGKRGQLETPGNHLCLGYQRPGARKVNLNPPGGPLPVATPARGRGTGANRHAGSETRKTKSEEPARPRSCRLFMKNPGGVLLSHQVALAVPSAPRSLTSEFG